MGNIWRTGIASLALSLLSAESIAKNDDWTPNQKQISHLEQKLEMPKGTHPLAKYGRYYWGETEKGERVIYGALVWGHPTGIHLKKPHGLKAFDQGCNWVFVMYRPRDKKPIARCDGLA